MALGSGQPVLRSAALIPAIERRRGRSAASSPPRQRWISSTWIAFIGSTYGFRSRTERWITG